MRIGNTDADDPLATKLLTVQQLAEWAKVSTKTIYRLIERGEVPVFKFSHRTYRIPAKALLEYLRNAEWNERRGARKKRGKTKR